MHCAGCDGGDQVRFLQDGQAGRAAAQVLRLWQPGADRPTQTAQHEPGQHDILPFHFQHKKLVILTSAWYKIGLADF